LKPPAYELLKKGHVYTEQCGRLNAVRRL